MVNEKILLLIGISVVLILLLFNVKAESKSNIQNKSCDVNVKYDAWAKLYIVKKLTNKCKK